jgi:tRNA pseudouridine55 synthase
MDGVFNIYKESGMTSHDVVSKVRRIIGQKRVGHTGTLDPMATGVLPVCVGKGTKAVEYIQGGEKVYRAGLRLGVSTDTQDISGTVLSSCGDFVSAGKFKETVLKFLGEVEQIPPMYSAIKQNGRKLCDLARKGIEVERKSRKVAIYNIDIISEKENKREYEIEVRCSKGTYIRTLIADIGDALGVGAVMTSLERVRSGCFCKDNAITVSELAKAAENQIIESFLISLDEIYSDLPKIIVDNKRAGMVRDGIKLKLDLIGFNGSKGLYTVYDEMGNLLIIAYPDFDKGLLMAEKSFFGR